MSSQRVCHVMGVLEAVLGVGRVRACHMREDVFRKWRSVWGSFDNCRLSIIC